MSVDITLGCKQVQGFTRKAPIKEDETISDDFDLDILMKLIKSMKYYYLDGNNCSCGNGHWTLIIQDNDDKIFFIKYEKDMSKERFEAFLQPLIDRFQH